MKTLMMIGLVAALAACSAPATRTPAPVPVAAAQTQSIQPFSDQDAAAQVNAIRSRAGLSALRQSVRLDRVAQGHAQDMAANDFFSHTGSNGSSIGQRARRGGYDWCLLAENIAKGMRSSDAAIRGWEASPSHYRNLTRGGLREFGLARAGSYWVMVLGATSC